MRRRVQWWWLGCALGWAATASAAGLVVVSKAPAAVTIDGDLGEWSGSPIRFDHTMLADATNVQDDRDLSGDVYVAYDSRYFYLAAAVTDDRLVMERSSGDLWQTDALEFWLGDQQFGFSLGGKEQRSIYATGWNDVDMRGARFVVVKRANGYNVETALPLAALSQALGQTLQPGARVPFAVGADDADVPGGNREGQEYFPPGYQWKRTDTFATAVLEQ